jgi:hypothetical protein
MNPGSQEEKALNIPVNILLPSPLHAKNDCGELPWII